MNSVDIIITNRNEVFGNPNNKGVTQMSSEHKGFSTKWSHTRNTIIISQFIIRAEGFWASFGKHRPTWSGTLPQHWTSSSIRHSSTQIILQSLCMQ